MEPKSLQEIRAVAEVRAELPPARQPLSRRERLERWAAALERLDGRRLRPLERVEFVSAHERKELRADNSPLTIAFEDPELRADGLQSDRFGDATSYFGLSNQQAHLILCDCHYAAGMRASEVARRIRNAATAGNTTRATFAIWALSLGAIPVVSLILSAI